VNKLSSGRFNIPHRTIAAVAIHNTGIAGVASDVPRPSGDGNELLKHFAVKFGMYQ
jgi:hypothetical protein